MSFKNSKDKFYDNLISSGTKINKYNYGMIEEFYDNLISSGTKIEVIGECPEEKFYDNLISSGTKIQKKCKIRACWVLR